MTFSILKNILIGATSLVLGSATVVVIGYLVSFGFHFPIYKDGGLWVRHRHRHNDRRFLFTGSIGGIFTPIAPGISHRFESRWRSGCLPGD